MPTTTSFKYYNKRNSPKYDEPAYNGLPLKCVIIASTPRVGSTLLSRGLSDIKLLPACEEYFQDMNMTDYLSRWGDITTQEYLQLLFTHRTNKSGFFGVKAHFSQLEPFISVMPDPSQCTFIFIERKNKIKQAVSLYIALAVGKWHVSSKSFKQVRKCNYNFIQLYSLLIDIIDQNNSWISFFAQHSIHPMHVIYESLSSNYEQTLCNVAKFLDDKFNDTIQLPPASFKKMANSLNDELYNMFCEDLIKTNKKHLLKFTNMLLMQ